jgi:uncharacterized protein YbjQ (UPF0145 family)
MKNIAFVLALAFPTATFAQDVAPAPTPITYEQFKALSMPVTASDIVGMPYQIVGQVQANVRKATIFSAAASQQKVYKELWERASKLKADAVINATYGESKISLWSWGQRKAVGTAIRFARPNNQDMPGQLISEREANSSVPD